MDKKSQNSGQEKSDSNDESIDSKSEKTGYEASDIIEDALQLAVDDELKEDREEINSESGSSSKVNINSTHNEVNVQKYTEDSTPGQTKAMLSPPKPETAPVVAPLTIEDKISMDTSKLRNTETDDVSMIVNLDETQSDLMDADNDDSQHNDSNDNKLNRKSINENNCSDSKTDSLNDSKNSSNEETKDLSKLSEKDSSKYKSSNQRENKVKNKESKNGSVSQKVQNTVNGRNIWVSGLSQNTKACELQTIFSKHGKVVSAKIIKNAKMSSRCFGFITMESNETVIKCIEQLNKTQLHGRTITLSRNRPQESASKVVITRNKPNSTKRDVTKNTSKESEVKETKTEDKSDENNKTKKSSEERHTNKTTSESGSNKGSETKINEKRKPIRPPVRDNNNRPLFQRRPIPMRRPIPFRKPFVGNSIRGFHRPGFGRGGIRPNFIFKRPDVDRNIRERERERRIREDRRRREEILRANYEREERIRLEREKERLKLERMNLEREKAEFFKIERERAKLEREKIEREREELRRRQQNQQPIIQHRMEDSRTRSTIMTSTINKRPFESRDMRSSDPFWEERKRLNNNMQRIDSHLMPGRQSFVESSSSVGNRHSIPHSYDNRNDSYKRNTRIELPMTGGSRTEFDARRHESRHGIGHDRDDRKSSGGPPYYRGEPSRGSSFGSRDRRLGVSQREDWKVSHDSRRSDRYSDKPMTANSFTGNSRYGSDSRGWNDRSSNSVNKMSYGSGNMHMSGSQQWTPSSSGRWNSAISSSSESRNRGQTGLNSSMLSSSNPSITELFGSQPMSGIQMNISHSMGGSAGNSLGTDRPYIHSNRRF